MSDTIISGRLHPITPIRRTWLFLTSIAWLTYGQRDTIADLHEKIGYWWMAAIVAALVALIASMVTLSWIKTSFRLTPTELDFRYGAMRRVERRFPVDQIRTVDVNRPVWARIIGVASVKVATQADNQQISYLSRNDAERIVENVRRILHGEVPSTQESGEGVLARVDSHMLGLSMLLNARLMVKLAISLPLALWPYLASDEVWSLALVLPWLRSAWNATGKKFPTQHGWTVCETESGFQTKRGLFNKTEHTWQQDRISSVTIHQPILWRSRNWVQVSAATVGYGGSVVLPVATRCQAEKLVAGLLGVESLKVLDVMKPVGRKARWCTPFWKACGYSETNLFVAGWKGLFLKQKITLARIDRVVCVETEQGWWQRRHGVASVNLLLPGGPDVEIVHRDLEGAASIARRMSNRVLAETLDAPRIRRVRLSIDARNRTRNGSDTPTDTAA